VVERIAGADEPVLITRGDAHSRNDPPVTAALLLGRVEGLRRHDREIPLEPPIPRQTHIHISELLSQCVLSIRRLAQLPAMLAGIARL
jgi:hypothetical protein